MNDKQDRPPTAEDIERDQLKKIRRDSTRILAFSALTLAILLIVAVIAGVIIGTKAYGDLHAQEDRTAEVASALTREKASLCDFFFVVATVPVADHGPHKSTPVLVRWIVDSRNTYTARGCTPQLPLPTSTLLNLAKQFDLKLNRLR